MGHAMVASTVANIHLAKGKKVTVEDFLPKEEKRKVSDPRIVTALFAAHCKTKWKKRGTT
jgi:hypothetical protein